MSATNWVTFHDRDSKELISVHPVVLGATAYLGGMSDRRGELLRTYGGFEVLIGHSFTPYDNLFYREGNLIGRNVTVGAWGTFGIELFAQDRHSLYLEGGGGFKTYRGLQDDEDPVAVGTAWVGSGANIEVGTRLYR